MVYNDNFCNTAWTDIHVQMVFVIYWAFFNFNLMRDLPRQPFKVTFKFIARSFSCLDDNPRCFLLLMDAGCKF